MTPVDPAAAARLDRDLDALARHRPAGARIDPVLAETVRLLDARRQAPNPDPVFAARLWETLMDAPATGRPRGPFAAAVDGSVAASGSRRPVPRLTAPWRWRPLAELATAAVLVLALVGSFASYRLGRPFVPAGAPPTADLYALVSGDGVGSGQIVLLDPRTLADTAERPSFATVSGDTGLPSAVSGDGSTLAHGEASAAPQDGRARPGAIDIVVRDVATGDERLRFRPPTVPAFAVRLSHDGSRLLLQAPLRTAGDPEARRGASAGFLPPAWYVYDVRDGRQLATWDGNAGGADGADQVADAALERLYYLEQRPLDGPAAMPTGPIQPQAVRLVVRDLTTGAVVGRSLLPGVSGGSWVPTSGTDDRPAYLGPALALAPDGRRLVVVHADEAAVTLIDASGLSVERTLELTRRTGIRDRLQGWLPLLPRSAAAKSPRGTWRTAVFAPDGRHLYVHGVINEVGTERVPGDYRGTGLQRIDLERGVIVAEALPGATLDALLPTADGREVYVFEADAGGFGKPSSLRRLDAATLTVLAERRYDTWPTFLLVPRSPPAAGS